MIELYGARDLTYVGAKLDVGEHLLDTFPRRLEDALDWVRDGIITDTKTAFGILHWAQFGTEK